MFCSISQTQTQCLKCIAEPHFLCIGGMETFSAMLYLSRTDIKTAIKRKKKQQLIKCGFSSHLIGLNMALAKLLIFRASLRWCPLGFTTGVERQKDGLVMLGIG